MPPPLAISLSSSSPDTTADIARDLAAELAAGDAICLTGDLGAGKSHVARTIIRHLTGELDIPSPTFTLIQTYTAPEFEIWHADLYRLSSPEEVNELGLEDAFGHAVCLIEWPDRLPRPPDNALWLNLQPGRDDQARVLGFTSQSERWSAPFERLANRWEKCRA